MLKWITKERLLWILKRPLYAIWLKMELSLVCYIHRNEDSSRPTSTTGLGLHYKNTTTRLRAVFNTKQTPCYPLHCFQRSMSFPRRNRLGVMDEVKIVTPNCPWTCFRRQRLRASFGKGARLPRLSSADVSQAYHPLIVR
jgi:hypothetical protein